MLLLDGATFFHWDASGAAGNIDRIGVFVFAAGTVLSVWSGYRYIARNAKLVFGDDVRSP